MGVVQLAVMGHGPVDVDHGAQASNCLAGAREGQWDRVCAAGWRDVVDTAGSCLGDRSEPSVLVLAEGCIESVEVPRDP